ncbi:MAG: ABC transporter ATP-binding protein [Bacillota bacterium]
MSGAILEVKNLVKYFPINEGIIFPKPVGYVKAVDDVSFILHKGETLGLVGESGCGKSTTGRCILRLLEPTSGQVFFQGQDIVKLEKSEMRLLRKDIQIIFQDPYASLNPRLTVGEMIAEPMANFEIGTAKDREKRVKELLEIVGLSSYHSSRYPHEFSGGQRQRIGIARALSVNPKLIVCDEPVSALDVSIQAQVLNLLKDLQKEFDLTLLFIAHDLSVVKHISNRVAVMYLGRIVEMADYKNLYREPLHPYSQALLSAIPIPNPRLKKDRILLEGDVPSPINPPAGCNFHTRCPKADEVCQRVKPILQEYKIGHFVSCHYANE